MAGSDAGRLGGEYLRARYVQVQTTTDSRAEAMDLARAAVEARLAAFLAQRHSYDEPEIIATPLVAGSASYLSWLRDETRPRPPREAGPVQGG
jgi:uncharacterized protein involved in tolerance to divalent cations